MAPQKPFTPFLFTISFRHFLLLFSLIIISVSSSLSPDHLLHSFYTTKPRQQSFEITPDDNHDYNHSPVPSCSCRFLRHSFHNSHGSSPVSVPYSPPTRCPAPWAHIVLELRGSCSGHQHHRTAAIWLGAAEILRTSTPNPTSCSATYWTVRKDVTTYTSLLLRSHISLSMMLVGHSFYRTLTGVFHIQLFLLYYTYLRVGPKLLTPKFDMFGGMSAAPADVVLPLSNDEGKLGFWSRIESESDIHAKNIRFPRNTRRAVLEVSISSHEDDELWYSNPPDLYLDLNHLDTGRGHGSFREMYVMIDGLLVGSEIPFPVIFSGGINPLFWDPVVAIGAFDFPSYDVELTPYLGLLVDGNPHKFEIGIIGGINYWLVGANLHLWVDRSLRRVIAKSVMSWTPSLSVKRKSKFNKLDGAFGLKGSHAALASGWVISRGGNLSSHVSRSCAFTSSVNFALNGTLKTVSYKIKSKTELVTMSETGSVIACRTLKRKFPLRIITRTLQGKREGTYLVMANVSHAWKEKEKAVGEWVGSYGRSVTNRQDSGGWMVVGKDDIVISGAAETRQRLSYKERLECLLRTVSAVNGKVLYDRSASCVSSSL